MSCFNHDDPTKATTLHTIQLHERSIVLMSAKANWSQMCTILAHSWNIFATWIHCCCRCNSSCEIGIKTLAFLTVCHINIGSTFHNNHCSYIQRCFCHHINCQLANLVLHIHRCGWWYNCGTCCVTTYVWLDGAFSIWIDFNILSSCLAIGIF